VYVKNEFLIWSYEGGLVRVEKINTLLKTYTHSSSFLLRIRRGNFVSQPCGLGNELEKLISLLNPIGFESEFPKAISF
jgi:hypothetical protein